MEVGISMRKATKHRTLVTGFGPFGKNATNPTSILAPHFDRHCRVLEVSYAAVDEFVEELPDFDTIVCLGLSAGARQVKMELFARNQAGKTKDVRGQIWGPAWIEKDGPPVLCSTLMPPDELFENIQVLRSERFGPSPDAGDYLCNFLYYRILASTRANAVFVHVPTFETMPAEHQFEIVAKIIGLAESR
jgi:pyrrolidone-carboxylate peptidase